MSAAQRMPIVGGTLAIGVTGAAMALIPSLREAVTRYLGISAPGGVWRILAIFFALLSLKSLPFVWHVRYSLPYLQQEASILTFIYNSSASSKTSSGTSTSNPCPSNPPTSSNP